jgi:hypothetical protein
MFYKRARDFALFDHNHKKEVRNAAYRLVDVFLKCLSARLEEMIARERESADIIIKVGWCRFFSSSF